MNHNALGLICIDLWEETPGQTPTPPEYHRWLNNLPNRLSDFNFSSIINASYDTKIDYNDPSIYNTLVAYNWHDFDPQVMLELIKNCNNYTMSKSMQTQVFGNQTFALYSIQSFKKHVDKLVPHVKDWLVIGNTWNICTHHRDLGLVNLSRLNEFNFYALDWGFRKINNQTLCDKDFEDDCFVKWEKINQHMYRLI
jgi:hypothetical protein